MAYQKATAIRSAIGFEAVYNNSFTIFPITVDAVGALVYVPALLTTTANCAKPWITVRLEQYLPTIRVWPQIEAFADEAATELLDRADASVNPEDWQLEQWGVWVPFPAAGILPKGGERLRVQLGVGPRTQAWLRVLLGLQEV